MSTCSGCGAEIRWVKTTTGKNMPLNPDPDPAGIIELIEPVGDEGDPIARVLPKNQRQPSLDIGHPRYTSHHATCPKATSYRR